MITVFETPIFRRLFAKLCPDERGRAAVRNYVGRYFIDQAAGGYGLDIGGGFSGAYPFWVHLTKADEGAVHLYGCHASHKVTMQDLWKAIDGPIDAVPPDLRGLVADLRESHDQVRRGEGLSRHRVTLASAARTSIRMSQAEFAKLLDVSVRTVQNWEQGRTEPSGAAKTLCKVAQRYPEMLRKVV